MIKDQYGEKKITPKQKARELLTSALDAAYYFHDNRNGETENMTQAEIEKVSEQVGKIAQRIEKILKGKR